MLLPFSPLPGGVSLFLPVASHRVGSPFASPPPPPPTPPHGSGSPDQHRRWPHTDRISPSGDRVGEYQSCDSPTCIAGVQTDTDTRDEPPTTTGPRRSTTYRTRAHVRLARVHARHRTHTRHVCYCLCSWTVTWSHIDLSRVIFPVAHRRQHDTDALSAASRNTSQ